MKRIYDISLSIKDGMTVYPGDPGVTVERAACLEDGDQANLSRLCFGSHTGTHIDPPRHFIQGGDTVDMLPLEVMVGPALVVEAHGDRIDRGVLAAIRLTGEERVIFKTKASSFSQEGPFREDFACLAKDAVPYLVEAGVKLVGIDYMSIEEFNGDGEVHRALLGSGVIVVEGLDLSGVEPGRYELICLPLKIKGGDGAPARVVLREL
jgi:arylformamidase